MVVDFHIHSLLALEIIEVGLEISDYVFDIHGFFLHLRVSETKN